MDVSIIISPDEVVIVHGTTTRLAALRRHPEDLMRLIANPPFANVKVHSYAYTERR
jgi:hypothetical protein